ncbi:hypothetical protein ACFL2H_05365 [Planctomycetota bacterium]
MENAEPRQTVYNTRVIGPKTDAVLDIMYGLIEPIEYIQRIYDSTPLEAIAFIYGDTPAVAKLKKAWKSLTKLSASCGNVYCEIVRTKKAKEEVTHAMIYKIEVLDKLGKVQLVITEDGIARKLKE